MNPKVGLKMGACLGFCALLVGCAHGYNPQTSSLSVKDQCTTLQRQMLFSNNYSINTSQWSTQVDQHQLSQQFHQLNCYKILGETEAS